MIDSAVPLRLGDGVGSHPADGTYRRTTFNSRFPNGQSASDRAFGSSSARLKASPKEMSISRPAPLLLNTFHQFVVQ